MDFVATDGALGGGCGKSESRLGARCEEGLVGGSVWYLARGGATCAGTGGSETGVAGEPAREINAGAAAVSDGGGAGGTCVGRSLSNVTMRRKIVA